MTAAITAHTGRCLPLPRSDVDTDQIIPASHCRKLTKTGYTDALFARWRADPEFVLNDPGRAGSSILLAGPNFGTGSSREHAVWALRDWGFRAVIAASFGDIFYRNAWRNGLLPVQLADDVVQRWLERATDRLTLTVDLREQLVVDGEDAIPFDAPERARWLLLNGLDEIEVALRAGDSLARYERARPSWLPRPSAGEGEPCGASPSSRATE